MSRAALPRSLLRRLAVPNRVPLRALATYEAQGLPMPKLGFNEICVRTPFVSDVAQTGHTLGFIDEILVQVGETVAVDQTVAVIETDKAAIDIRSPVAGQISKLCVSPEDKVYELHPVAIVSGAESPRVRLKSPEMGKVPRRPPGREAE